MSVIESYDPYSEECLRDPYEHYRWLRDNHPIYFVPQYDMWVISRFEDIWNLLSDSSLPFQAREGTVVQRPTMLIKNDGVVPPESLDPLGKFSMVDPPLQGELRGLVNQPFRPVMVQRLEPWFRDMVRSEMPALLARGRFNMPEEFGRWSGATMLKLAGLPFENGHELHEIVSHISELDGDPHTPAEKIDRGPLRDIALEAIAHRREAGADGSCPFIDKGINGTFRGEKLTDLELATTLLIPFIGGVETLPKIASHGLWELSRRPDQLAAVRADLVPNTAVALEEMTRYCGPAQWFARTVIERVEVLGETLLPGQRVIFLMQSASRDPREFDNPDEFIWNRTIPRSLAFGQGDHFCMGIHLAKMEGRVILQEFLSLVEDYAIDEAAAVWSYSSFQKGWDHLPVEIRSYRTSDELASV